MASRRNPWVDALANGLSGFANTMSSGLRANALDQLRNGAGGPPQMSPPAVPPSLNLDMKASPSVDGSLPSVQMGPGAQLTIGDIMQKLLQDSGQ